MSVSVVMINDDRTGRLKARTVNIDYLVKQAAEQCEKTGRVVIKAGHGGTVCNSYGYRAETECAVAVAIPEERVDGDRCHFTGNVTVAVYASQLPANKTTLSGVAGKCLPVAVPVFDWRYNDASTNAARKATIAEVVRDLEQATIVAQA